MITKILVIAVILTNIALIAFLFVGCTLSFQNIDTHGTATDLVDDNLSTAPSVKVPLKGV